LEDRTEYFERMLVDNPDNPTGLLAPAKEYNKAERYEDQAAVLERYVAAHERKRTDEQHPLWIRFSAQLIGDATNEVNSTRA
jgi:Tfp pilus assembly protein PilF